MNILRKVVHQVGFIYKIIQRCTVNKTQNARRHFTKCSHLVFVHYSCNYDCSLNINKRMEFNSRGRAKQSPYASNVIAL